MLKSILAGAVLLSASAFASAEETALRAEDTRLVTAIELADLEALVISLGHEIDERGTLGDVSVRAVDETGLIYLLAGTACETPEGEEEATPRCMGINMQVRYTADEAVTLEKINEANLSRAAVSVWLSDQTLGVARYVILDGGQTMGNIKENLIALLSIAPYITETIWPMPEEEIPAEESPNTLVEVSE